MCLSLIVFERVPLSLPFWAKQNVHQACYSFSYHRAACDNYELSLFMCGVVIWSWKCVSDFKSTPPHTVYLIFVLTERKVKVRSEPSEPSSPVLCQPVGESKLWRGACACLCELVCALLRTARKFRVVGIAGPLASCLRKVSSLHLACSRWIS